MPSTFLSRGQDWLADKLPALGVDADVQDSIEYRPTGGRPAFIWTGILTGEHGLAEWSDDGERIKIIQRTFTGPIATPLANDVSGLELQSTVAIDGDEWKIDVNQSHWGPLLATLRMTRREISRFEEMESHAAVR